MSFKREGDDKCLLNNLRHRRLKELLGEDIPKDEALLLSNGRYTCLVCAHRPIFDTVNVLYLHRQGKKHIANFQHFHEKKKELKDLIQKRKHDQFIFDGSTNIKQADMVYQGLGCGPAYDSRSKKKKVTHRKLSVDLNSMKKPDSEVECYTDAGHQREGTLTADTYKSKFERESDMKKCSNGNQKIRNNRMFRDMLLKQQREGPVKHSSQLKNIFHSAPEKPVIVEPYRKKRISSANQQPINPIPNPSSSISVVNGETGVNRNGNTDSSNPSGIDSMIPEYKISQICKLPPPPPPPPEDINADRADKATTDKIVTQEAKAKAEKYLFFRGAGWKKDLLGHWVKDDDAEFDSDEEPPDLP